MMKKIDQILCTRQVETAFSGISLPEFVSEFFYNLWSIKSSRLLG